MTKEQKEYRDRLERAAVAAMQGILASTESEYDEESVVDSAMAMAIQLVRAIDYEVSDED
jgi:hypothetical protein